MDSSGFPFDKLIKICIIVILTTLPLGLYFYIHAKQQTDYLNQRNFRALNEIIFQYQDHFKALNNLFKFPPPDEEKHFIYSYEFVGDIDKQFIQLKKELITASDKDLSPLDQAFHKWVSSLLKEIDSIKKNDININKTEGQTDIDNRDILNKVSNNLSEKRRKLNNLLISLFGPSNDPQVINLREYFFEIDRRLQNIEHLLKRATDRSGKIGPDTLKGEKIKNTALFSRYKSRLRLNKSLGDISVKLDKEYKKNQNESQCFIDIKFVLNDSSEPATVDASGCGYEYRTTIPSLIGNIRHNEFDAVILVNQDGKVLFSKELTALRWREGIDSLDQTNFTGLAITNIERTLKKAANGSIAKPNKDKKETTGSEEDKKEKPSLIGLSTTRTEEIGGKEYIFFFQPFKLNYKFYKGLDGNKKDLSEEIKKILEDEEKAFPPSTFYMIGLVEESKFRKETISIPSSFSAFVFVVLLFGILFWSSVKLSFIGVTESITRGDLRFLLISLFIMPGVAIIFFISLLTMEIMEKKMNNTSVKTSKQISEDFNDYLTNIITEFHTYKNTVLKYKQGEYRSNLDNYVSGIHIKSVNNIDEQEKIITDFKDKAYKNRVLIVDTINDPENWIVAGHDDKGKFKSQQVKKRVEAPENKQAMIDWITSALKLNLRGRSEKPNIFPQQRDIFTVNVDGILFQKMHFFVEDFYTTLKLRIPKRDYFKIVMNGNAWHTESDRIYLQRIRNYSDGVKSTQFSMPITKEDFSLPMPKSSYNDQYQWVEGKKEEKPPRVIASTTYFQSLIAPVLPHGLQYAIIDDNTGEVLYHSKDEKAFTENFYSETEFNNELIAAIKSGKEHRNRWQDANHTLPDSIPGIYHAEQTNFHVRPLESVPWSLITFYPKELAHAIAIQSGITTFAGFLLYTLIFYFIIQIFSFCNSKLKKDDDFSCVWLWPARTKNNQYIFVFLLLIPFCLVFSLGIYYLDGPSLIGYLLVAIVAQLCLIYFSLNKNWTDIKSSPEHLPMLVVLLFALVTLVFINEFSAMKNDTLVATIILIFLILVLGLFSLENHLRSTLHQFTNKQHANLKFKTVFITMITVTLLLFSTIPSIALYKDSLTFYSQMLSRQGQLDVAHNLQKQYTKLETFAKLFFPEHHAMSNGHTKCSQFDFVKVNSDRDTGIYGFNPAELKLNTQRENKPNDYGCSIVNNKKNDDDSIMDSSFSGFLFQRLAGFHLYLSHQYTAAQDNFIEKNWQFDSDNTLTFTTIGINGKLAHTIRFNDLDLSTVFLTLIPESVSSLFHEREQKDGQEPNKDESIQPEEQATKNESLSISAALLFLLIGVFFIAWFFPRRVAFIVKQVFAIDFPEIINNEPLEKLIQNELALSGQCWVFIHGAKQDITEFCAEQARKTLISDVDLKKVTDTDIDDSDLEKFVYSLISETDKNDNNGKKNLTFYVIPDFSNATNNQKTRRLLLSYLENILRQAREEKESEVFILICAEVHPLRYLVRPELFYDTHMRDFAYISSQEKYRWIKILAAFLEHKSYKKNFTHDTTKKNLLKEKDIETNEKTKYEIIELLGNHNYPYYRRLWEICNRDERLMLYQLATDRFANPNNRGVIRNLYNRGYIIRDPFFKIPDESFKKFIASAEPVSTFHNWEKQAAHGLWENIKVPLFIALVFLAGLFIYISTDAIETTIGLLTPLLALIPLLLRGINSVQAKEAVETVTHDDVPGANSE